MRRIWNLFGEEKQKQQQQPQPQKDQPAQQNNRDDGSTKGSEDGEEDTMVDRATQTTLSREVINEPATPEAGTPVASTPVRDERSVDEGAKKKSRNRRKRASRSSEAKTPKSKTSGSIGKRKRSKEVTKVNRSKERVGRDEEKGGKNVWKEESSSEERRKKTPAKKIVEAREVNKADDEEFENDGKAPMARSKIKTRDLKWKGSEESPTKTTTDEDRSGTKTPKKKKVAEAREENKADDEEFENDGGKAVMAKSKIKTRDLKWKSKEQMHESPGKTGSGSDSGGSEKKQPPKKVVKPKMVEARDVNKADDEEFENEGKSMARSRIKTRDLKWKKEEPEKPVIAEARELNKEDDEEFENGSGAIMAKSKIKTRDLKWKKDEEASTPSRATRSHETTTDSTEARSPIRIVEAREVNKADDEEFENEGKSMARSKIKSRDLQWKKEDASPSKPAPTTPEKKKDKEEKETKSVMSPPPADSPEAPTQRQSMMQMLVPEKKKEQPSAERSVMAAPSSPASPSPVQISVRKEVMVKKEETTVDKSAATRSRHTSKNEEASRESADKSVKKRRLLPSLNLSRKSKSRHDKKDKHEEKEKSSDSSHSQHSHTDKSSKERTSLRMDPVDVAASAVDKSMKSIKSIFKKSDDTKKRPEDLLPHVERDARDVTEARRLMEMLKRNNVFENALFPFQNETLRAYFTSGSRRLDKNTMDLLFKAADFVLDKILYRGEELDEYIDSPLKTFILNRTKSRTMVVELLLKNAEFLPQTWGGRTVVLMRSEEEVTVAPEDEKSKKEARSSKKEDEKK